MFKRIEIGDDGSATAVPNELRGALMRPELKATAQSFAEKIQAATPQPERARKQPHDGADKPSAFLPHRRPSGWGVKEAQRAEGVGFEPTMTLPRHSGFQDRRTRPLCEPSEYLTGILPRTHPGDLAQTHQRDQEETGRRVRDATRATAVPTAAYSAITRIGRPTPWPPK